MDSEIRKMEHSDAETGALHFDSGKFRQILDLAEKYPAREEGVAPGESLLEGNTLCNSLTIQKPEDVAAYRIIYGEDVDYIGYEPPRRTERYHTGRTGAVFVRQHHERYAYRPSGEPGGAVSGGDAMNFNVPVSKRQRKFQLNFN